MIQHRLQKINQELDACLDRQSLIKLLINMGKPLAPGADRLVQPDHRVPGCAVDVFLGWSWKNGGLECQFYTESSMVAGILSLLLAIYQGEAPYEMVAHGAAFYQESRWQRFLPQSKRLGLSSIGQRFVELAEGQLRRT